MNLKKICCFCFKSKNNDELNYSNDLVEHLLKAERMSLSHLLNSDDLLIRQNKSEELKKGEKYENDKELEFDEDEENTKIKKKYKTINKFPDFSQRKNNQSEFPLFNFDDIQLLEKLGKGGMAKVFKGYHKKRCEYLAIKFFLHPDPTEKIQERKKITKEDFLLKKVQVLNNPIFLQYYGMYENSMKNGDLILEMESGIINLDEIISAEKKYSNEEIAYVVSKIAYGYRILEENNITHRDVKPQNIIISEKNHEFYYKISDFGEGEFLENNGKLLSKSTISGLTKRYASPEVLDSDNLNEFYNPYKADVYSLGIMMLKMIGINNKTIENIKKDKKYINFDKEYKVYEGLIESMLMEDPDQRPNFQDIELFLQNIPIKQPNDETNYIKIHNENRLKKITPEKAIKKDLQLFRLYFDLSRIQEAKIKIEEAMQIMKEKYDQVQNTEQEARILQGMGKISIAAMDFLKGEEFLLKSVKIIQQLLGYDQEKVPSFLHDLIHLYLVKEDLDKALEYIFKEAEILYKIYNENSEEIGKLLHFIAMLYSAKQNHGKARIFCLKSLNIFLNMNSKESANSLDLLSMLYNPSIQKNQDKIKRYLFNSLQIRQNLFGNNHVAVSISLANIGKFYIQIGNFNESEKFLIESLKITEILFGINHVNTGLAIFDLGELFKFKYKLDTAQRDLQNKIGEQMFGEKLKIKCSVENFKKAEYFFLKSLKIIENVQEVRKVFIFQSLGELFLIHNQRSKAEKFLLEAVNESRNLNNELHCIHQLNNLGRFYLDNNLNLKDSEKVLTEALLKASNLEKNHELLGLTNRNLGLLYFNYKKYNLAKLHTHKALEIYQNDTNKNNSKVMVKKLIGQLASILALSGTKEDKEEIKKMKSVIEMYFKEDPNFLENSMF